MRTGITEYVSQNRYLAYQYDNLNRLVQEDSYNASTMNSSTDDGYTAMYEYDIAGNRLGRQVTVVRNSSNPESNVLSTDYTEYDSGDRLRKEHSIDQAIFASLGDENSRILAFADGQGGFGYKYPDSKSTIGQFKAFLMGLPSVWNRWLLITLMICIPIAFLWPSLTRWIYKACRIPAPAERPTLSLYHRSLCILFAYVFLIGPEVIQTLAYTDTQYHQLSTQAWGHAGDTITYYYDANGSLTYKIYADVSTTGDPASIVAANTSLKYDKSDYSLQNHLSKLTQYSKPAADAIRLITEYFYAPDGIRVSSKSYKTVNNGSAQDKTTTNYLVDPANHTGYAQVLEEQTTSYNASDIPTTQNRIHYTIGDDIISQTKSDWTWNTGTSAWTLSTPYDTEYLLYDGQGSTRQLVRPNKTVIENYNYDSYGVMLGGNPTTTAPAATKLLYTGEQYDTAAQSYYLRARYYDPMNGRFTQMDPYGGNTQDPQSLHKYTYCHNDPVNGVDPSGMMEFSLTGLMVSVAIGAVLTNVGLTVYSGIRHNQSGLSIAWSVIQNLAAFIAIAGAILLTGPIAVAAALTLVVVSIVGIINLIRSWPKMDTTDKIITAATMLTFIVFAGAIKTGVSPSPEPVPEMSGAASVLPESYFSRVAVDMRNAPPGSPTNAAGFPRNGPWFWRQVRNTNPEFFSKENLTRIAKNKAPKVDAQWVKHHPQHQSFIGDTLIHHHIGQGPIAVGMPEIIHRSWARFLNTSTGLEE